MPKRKSPEEKLGALIREIGFDRAEAAFRLLKSYETKPFRGQSGQIKLRGGRRSDDPARASQRVPLPPLGNFATVPVWDEAADGVRT